MTKKFRNLTILMVMLALLVAAGSVSFFYQLLLPFGIICFLGGSVTFLLIAYTLGKDRAENNIKEIVGEA